MKNLKNICYSLIALGSIGTFNASAQQREVKISVIETTDIHGNYLPYNFLDGTAGSGSMGRVSAYVDSLRNANGKEHVILLDNGDILQGQPSAYYYNFMDTKSPHLCSEALNYLNYDAVTVGNHDIETGHAVYDRWIGECKMPVLGANVIDTKTGKPYWKPYTIIERDGVKVAVIGMITPAIPQWLPENLWSGLRFDDIISVARKYMPEMKKKADVVIALVHTGAGKAQSSATSAAAEKAENVAVRLAKEVPGFDVVFCGHDHRRRLSWETTSAGDSVLVANPAANCMAVAQADIDVTINGKQLKRKDVDGKIVDIADTPIDKDFLAKFAGQADSVTAFTSEIIGECSSEMTTTPAFFGSSAFIDFIHKMQLSISGADISFTAPLSLNATIKEGDIYVRDMFKLYSYENLLYVMTLSGQEIKDYLEYSYSHWTAQMTDSTQHMLLFRSNPEQISNPWQRLQNPSYNFDSAAGLKYTVDLRKPAGEKVTIESLADGRPFHLDKTYRCAINSYRGNGGGGLLTEGAGIPASELKNRIVWSTEHDLRFYMMQAIRQLGVVRPEPLNHWKFIPESWVEQARKTDEPLLQ